MQKTLYLITLKTIKYMKISTKAATFLSSIKTQTYFLKYNHNCISVYYIMLGTNMAIL